MDKLFEFRTFDRDLLFRFSERSIRLLTGRSPMNFAASFTADYLRQNVEKETEKDRLIIEHASQAFDDGRLITAADVNLLFDRTKEIDSAFVRQLVLPSVSISIRYEDIEETRKRRILFLARLVEDLLMIWSPDDDLGTLFRRYCSADRFHDILTEYLDLYILETRQLTNSVKFLPPLNRAMDLFVEEIVETMEEVREPVVLAVRDRFYGNEDRAA